MGIFDKLKYGNTFGKTVSIKDTVVKQYPKEIKQVEEPIVEKPKSKKKSTPSLDIEETL